LSGQTQYDPDKKHRRSIRLKQFDYSRGHPYFVTVCTWQKECLLSNITNDTSVLTEVGTSVESVLASLPERYPVHLDAYVLMPNHVHMILFLMESIESGTPLGGILRAFKSRSAIGANRLLGRSDRPFWQRNYFERVLRDTEELATARRYVRLNPSRWGEDKENPDNAVLTKMQR
jgi:putative transposase